MGLCMAVVHIRISGRDYSIACDDGQEEQLRFLADEVDDRIRSLVFRMGGNPGEEMALLLTSLTMADELIESKKEIEALRGESRSGGNVKQERQGQARLQEIEAAMTATLEDIALRIEKIAEQVEVG
jgi:cell division protein ZapA